MSKTILFFHPHTARGGTEQNIVKISKGLQEEGHKVHFCAFEDNGDLYEEIGMFADSTHIISNVKKHPFKSIRNYKKILKDINPDVVLNFGLRVDLFSRILSNNKQRKVISNIRSTDNWRKWYHTRLDKLTQHKIDFWIANATAGKDAFVKREGLNPDKVEVIYNFIEYIPSEVRNYKQINDQLKIGVLANIRPAKGHEVLIKVANELKKKGIRVRFILAGKDMMNGTLFQTIEENQLKDYFEFRGFVKDTAAFLNEIDISLLPSRWEGMPTSVLEAMSFGVPVIATRVGGVPEIITSGTDGIIVEVDDVNGMTNAISNLLSSDLRKQIGLAGKLKIETNFSKAKIMRQWIQIIND